MQEKAVFHLYIPSLLQPLNSWYQDFLFDLESPNLSLLLSNYKKKQSIHSQSLESAFFNSIDSKVEELPVAFYRHQVHSNDIRNELICADPVHFEVGMNDVTLTKIITDLTDSEAEELIGILNKHFEQDGLKFIFGSNQCWYVSGNDDDSFRSYELDSVLMQNITDKLPSSEKRNWQVIQNETQMLLHTSEVNLQREIAGLDTVNSLWFWGAGKPIERNHNIQTIYSSTDIFSKTRGESFAKAANCEWQALLQDFSQLLEQVTNDNATHVLILDQLFTPALINNLDDFQREVEQIDSSIIDPLFEAWRNNKIEIVIDCCDGTILKPQKPPLWKMWSKSIKLRELANEINS